MQDSTWREKLKASGTHCFFSPLLPSRWTATQPVQFFILSQSGERRSLNRRAGQGRPYPKTDRKGDTLGAINLGQRGYGIYWIGRVGTSEHAPAPHFVRVANAEH